MFAVADDNARALALLKGVEQERLKYDCFHIRYEEYRAEESQTVEQVVDFDKEKINKSHIPHEFFPGNKSILLADIIYYMPTYEGKHVAFVPHRSPNAFGSGIYDPRLLGLIDMMSHTGNVAECLPASKNFSVSRENLNGRSVYVVECQDGPQNGNAIWKLYIEEPGLLLLRKTVDAEWGKVQIDSDYSEKRFLPFPTKVHIYRIDPRREEKEQVIFDQHITVKDVQIKKSFPPETFTLAGLNPSLNSDVVDYRIKRRLGYWDGEKLVDDPVSVSAQERRELMEPKRGWGNYLLMGIGGALILGALLRILFKRIQMPDKERRRQ